jgi:hypothetical protein
MNNMQLRRMRLTLARTLLVPALLALTSIGLGSGAATAHAGSQAFLQPIAPQCDPYEQMHAATREYRMFYDQAYIAEQRMAEASNWYRQLYDHGYAAEQSLAAATAQNCLAEK